MKYGLYPLHNRHPERTVFMAALFSVLCLIGLPNEEGRTDGRTYWAFRQLQQNEPPVV